MSTVLSQIQEEEAKALKDVEGVKSEISDAKNAVLHTAEARLKNTQKESDKAYSNKLEILDTDLKNNYEEAMVSLEKEMKDLDSSRPSLVSSGVEFVLSRLPKIA